jgi:hypothetical protein
MSENEEENYDENVQDNEESNEPEPLLKRVTPVFKPGRPRKSDEEKLQTRRAMLDRRNERNKARVQVDKVLKEQARTGGPMIADFNHTKNNRVDGVINPNLDPLFNDKLEMEKKLLQKKYIIEERKLDLYLQQMNGPQTVEKPKRTRAPRAPPKPKQQPSQTTQANPKQKTAQEITDDIFKMYS